jgi:hypothetical protein
VNDLLSVSDVIDRFDCKSPASKLAAIATIMLV